MKELPILAAAVFTPSAPAVTDNGQDSLVATEYRRSGRVRRSLTGSAEGRVVAARVVGWTAHIAEQLASNALIRPLSEYVGPDERHVPVSWHPLHPHPAEPVSAGCSACPSTGSGTESGD